MGQGNWTSTQLAQPPTLGDKMYETLVTVSSGPNAGIYKAPRVVLMDDNGNIIDNANPLPVSAAITPAPPPTAIISFEFAITDFLPHALPSNVVQDQVTIQSDKDNQGVLLVGDATSQNLELFAGNPTPPVKIDNTDRIYVAADPAATLPLIVNVFGS